MLGTSFECRCSINNTRTTPQLGHRPCILRGVRVQFVTLGSVAVSCDRLPICLNVLLHHRGGVLRGVE
jgi:hypothetical protein